MSTIVRVNTQTPAEYWEQEQICARTLGWLAGPYYGIADNDTIAFSEWAETQDWITSVEYVDDLIWIPAEDPRYGDHEPVAEVPAGGLFSADDFGLADWDEHHVIRPIAESDDAYEIGEFVGDTRYGAAFYIGGNMAASAHHIHRLVGGEWYTDAETYEFPCPPDTDDALESIWLAWADACRAEIARV